jgi:hypothetical protein
MHADPATHPSGEQLAAYGLGKLDDAEATGVGEHLETCEGCRQSVEDTPPDPFVQALQAARPAPEPTLPPELANHPRFRIVRELGRGGMGCVYLAEHRLMERPVAIKVLGPALVENPTAAERFRREVRAAAKLDHMNIVRGYDAEQAGELHLFVMEYVAGPSLADVVASQGPLPVARACDYVRQAALALQHAFERGMVHRDLKPQNLMLVPDAGTVKVLDFGLARLASERQAGPGLTAANAVMGTPEYLAPEQAADARQADIRADVYSLGCTLYCLLTGRPPFAGPTAMQTLLAHREQEAAPLHEVRPEVPAELSAVVARMLAKDPAQRYQTPKEVAEVLAPFSRPTPEPAATGPAPAAERKQPPAGAGGRPRPVGRALAAGILGLALLLGILLLVQTKEGTVEIELSDPNAQVEVTVDGETVQIVGVGRPLKLTAGDRQLRVTVEDFETITRSFTVKRGGNPALRVELKPLAPGREVRYLSDMQEFGVKVVEGPPGVPRFAKKGDLGYGEGDPRYANGRVSVNGRQSPNGLSMCPDSNTYACAKYKLGMGAHTFLASVALNDSAGGAGLDPGVGRIPTALTFVVLGDGKVLWKSRPVEVARKVQQCEVALTGVEVLELRVDCPGDNTNAQAVWLEPRVLLK